MLAQATERERLLTRRATRLLGGSRRHVDLAVEVVAVDGTGRLRYGGRFDTVTRQWDGAPSQWETWGVGQGQIPPLAAEGRFVCVGAMGAGKTEVIARRAVINAIRAPGKSSGVVAPTQKRLRICWEKIARLVPRHWVSDVRVSDGEIVFINGHRLQFVAAKIYSKDIGSPIQGYSWVACVVDEEQDVEDEAMADVMMRGREAPGGIYPVVSTCTLKDTQSWRERKQRYDARLDVTLYRMEARANPFVPAEYWERLKRALTPRQYRMRVLALDARPERATYPDFELERHVRPLPEIGVRDVTEREVGAKVLIGYDPGSLQDTSVLLKAYTMGRDSHPIWWIVGEVITRPGHAPKHAADVAAALMRRFGAAPGDAIIRADPFGNTETKPHHTVYTEFKLAGFQIKPAVYKKNPTAKTAADPGSLPKDARIAVVNTLLLNEAGETRLYLQVGDDGVALARGVANSLQVSERDERGRAETYRKTESDPSHPTAALGYALYHYERARLMPANLANGVY